jgi:hypothetical protein
MFKVCHLTLLPSAFPAFHHSSRNDGYYKQSHIWNNSSRACCIETKFPNHFLTSSPTGVKKARGIIWTKDVVSSGWENSPSTHICMSESFDVGRRHLLQIFDSLRARSGFLIFPCTNVHIQLEGKSRIPEIAVGPPEAGGTME